ncbi:MAG: CPBP family intramembrane metalloprotease [Alphaproteobacteria bacterium]|nr:CPBP family intramembrane metalloprotease [Alphaproteobacteria bacterium]
MPPGSPRYILRAFALWLAGLLVAWSLVWGAYTLWLDGRLNDAQARLWWESWKALLWLVPMATLAPQVTGVDAWEASGLGGGLHLRRGLAASAAWVGASVGVAWLLGEPLAEARMDASALRLVLFVPLVEEILFRGFVLTALLRNGVGRGSAFLLSGLAFGAIHLPGWFVMNGVSLAVVGQAGRVALLGVFLAWVTERRGVWPAVLVHAANNALSVGVLAWLLSRVA